jgi:flagellar biosynthesis protein FlhA
VHLAPVIVQQIYGAGEGAGRDRARTRTRAPGGAGPDLARTAPRWTPAWPTPDPQRRRHRAPQEDLGVPACLLVPDLIRAPMARLLRVPPRA